jgi:hypothetical protein
MTTFDQSPSTGEACPDRGDVPPWAAEYSCTDRQLLDLMVSSQVEQNRAHAARLEAMYTFHARRVAEREPSTTRPGTTFFKITPLLETQAEVAPLTGTGEQSVQIAIDTAGTLTSWFPNLWERFRRGRLDLSKVLACADQLPYLATDADRTKYAAAVQDWFDKHDPLTEEGDEATGPLCTLTRDKIQRAARYQRLKLPQRSEQERFADAFRKRRVSLRVDQETGMACLSSTAAAHDAITADHRLTLIAKSRAQAPGETRTLSQLRADSLFDLIHGRLSVPATTGDLEHQEQCDENCRVNGDGADERVAPPDLAAPDVTTSGERFCPLHPLVLTGDNGGPLGGYARSVFNVTVPITTLMGLTDDPGLLSGGIAVPGDYLRHIQALPGTSWYRMITDDVGNFLALSTESYEPTPPIVRSTTARDHTCLWPSCRRPAVLVELDHRVPFPLGKTSTDNLGPLCRRHHKVKHAEGYRIVRNANGSYTWTTRHGSTFTTPASEQPVAVWPEPVPAPATETATAPETETAPATESDDQTDEARCDGQRVNRMFGAITSPMETAFAALVRKHQ